MPSSRLLIHSEGTWEAPLGSAPAFENAVESLEPVAAMATAGELSEAVAAMAPESSEGKVALLPVVSQGQAVAVLFAQGGEKALDWNGLERYREVEWHRQGHIFKQPFYYIEYGIALLGALQLWIHARKNQKEAVARYRAALALGGSRRLPERFAAAGLRFEFGEDLVGPVVDEAFGEWKRLQAEV